MTDIYKKSLPEPHRFGEAFLYMKIQLAMTYRTTTFFPFLI